MADDQQKVRDLTETEKAEAAKDGLDESAQGEQPTPPAPAEDTGGATHDPEAPAPGATHDPQ